MSYAGYKITMKQSYAVINVKSGSITTVWVLKMHHQWKSGTVKIVLIQCDGACQYIT